MGYADTLSPIAKQNASILVQRMADKGITNPNTQAAILAVVSKESGFIPQRESMKYSASRLQQVYGISASTANSIVGDDVAIANAVYGGKGGNGANEGYAYRGGGYNQLTFKNNYLKIGREIGVDLVNNPDLIDDPKIAADAVIQYFVDGINDAKRQGILSQYNSTGINDFKTPADSLGIIYRINAGLGHSKAFIDADVTGGKAKATERVGDLFDFAKSVAKNTLSNSAYNTVSEAYHFGKKHWLPLTIGLGCFAAIGVLIIVYKPFSKGNIIPPIS